MQLLVNDIEGGLSELWKVPVLRHRVSPVVPVEDNYDRLGYGPDAVARDARYTRYLSPDLVLRTHTSAMIPPLLQRLAENGPQDALLSCPGIVYRRDAIDRTHTGEPHQIDLWRIGTGEPSLGVSDLEEMIGAVVEAVLAGYSYRTLPAEHPYTLEGREIEIKTSGGWLEIGECGLAQLGKLPSGACLGRGCRQMLFRIGSASSIHPSDSVRQF
jgi:phenylalanyl-tRNA synthetase alpha chain